MATIAHILRLCYDWSYHELTPAEYNAAAWINYEYSLELAEKVINGEI